MSNTVGSREVIPIVLWSEKNQQLELSQEEFDVLLGSVLGDGYITKLGRIQIEQGKAQKKCLEWKYERLKRIVSTSILTTERRPSLGIKTISYRFWTKQYFHSWRNGFYPLGIKVIPHEVELLLSPLVLAVWFMDDGFMRKENTMMAIATEMFSEGDGERICQAILKRYGVKASIVSRGRMYFSKDASKRFAQVISPHIIPEMRYKLP